jgi:hypothetical protein
MQVVVVPLPEISSAAVGKRAIVAVSKMECRPHPALTPGEDTNPSIWTNGLQIGEQPDTIIPIHICLSGGAA